MAKGESASIVAKGEKEDKGKRGRRAGGFTFPHHPLKEALRLAEAISRENAGAPFSRITLAKVLDLSPAGNIFRDMIYSSSRYGLTIGSHSADKITLTDAGREIVSNTSDEQTKKKRLLETLMLPKVFQDMFNRFNGQSIPREIALKDTLKSDFSVPSEDVNAVYSVLLQNMNDYGLIEEVKGTKYLQLEKLSPPSQLGGEADKEEPEKKEAASDKPKHMETPPPPPQIPRVFISHSKNKNILSQIKQMLDFGKFEYVIAEEKETTAIPLSDKVFTLMWECNCAIINISADAEKKEGETYGLNENVIAELWGAYLHYKKRVIIVIDKRLKEKLPSILQGLTAIFYEGDELSWTDGMRLQKALSEFRNQLCAANLTEPSLNRLAHLTE